MKDGNLTNLYTKETRPAQSLTEHGSLVLERARACVARLDQSRGIYLVTAPNADWFAS
jgi:DNA-binding transcriptional LysR family regulator